MYKHVKKGVGVLTACLALGCGMDDYNLQRVFIENSHVHVVEVEHAHDFEHLDHTHNPNEFFTNQLVVDEDMEVAPEPTNPFDDILTASKRILELEGGRELLKIAVMPRVSEAQKMQMILRAENSEAKKLLLKAFVENQDVIADLELELENALK